MSLPVRQPDGVHRVLGSDDTILSDDEITTRQAESRLYLCERCLGEQRLTFHNLVLATSAGRHLRCTDTECNGFAYLADSETNERYMRNRDRSKPLLRAAYGRR